jgi:hypothetical protein
MDKDHNGHKNASFRETVFMGHRAHVKHVAEPSDIIWENLHHHYWHRKKMEIIVSIVILIFLSLSFVFFTFLKTQSGEVKMMYPSNIDCKKDIIGEMD